MSFHLLLPLVACALGFSLAGLVLTKNLKSLVHQTFALLLIFGGLWDFAIFGMRASPDLSHAFVWEKAVLIVLSITAIILYRFSFAHRNIRLSKIPSVLIYLFPVSVIILIPTGLVVSGMQLKPYGYAPIPGPLFSPVALGFYLFAILALTNLVKSYKTSTSYDERNRNTYIIIGLSCSLIGGIADILPLFGLLPYPGAIIGNIIFAVLASVAMLRYHLLDIHIVVRKSIAYLLTSAAVAIPYAGIVFLFANILKTQEISPWIYLALLIILASLLQPLWSRVQRLVDRWFYRERYDYLRTLQQFSQETKDITNLGYLADSLIKLVSQAMQTTNSYLMLRDPKKKHFAVVSSYSGLAKHSQFTLGANSVLIRWLSQHDELLERRDLDILPQLQGITMKERNILDQAVAQLFIPMKTTRGLIGILILGSKLSGEAYSEDDVKLLAVVSHQMAITLENARLYNESQQEVEERKRAEEALRESKEQLRKMFESVTDGISVVDLSGIITEVNQRAAEIHGLGSRGKLLGRNALELVAPRDHERIATNIRKAIKRGSIRGVEYTLLKADGTEFPGELSTSVLRDASGKAVGHVNIARDITERKQAEEKEKQLQQELYLSRRLASVGELAAGVAHEINNPLTGVLGFSQRLLKKSSDEEVCRDLEIIYGEAQRAAKVVQNLLTFARRREPKKEHSNINDIVQKTLELRAYELKTGNIEVIIELTPNLPQVVADFHQIQEVFLNIVLNAEQAMNEAHGEGKLIIKTREIKDSVRISFADNGPGIPPEQLDKVFDPFFTTRAEKGGTGLGLSACHGVVTEHGGRIYARSKPGSGATFFVELPVIDESEVIAKRAVRRTK